MSVVIETTLGDITVDLYTKERPRACINFVKLCKMKYYNFNLFHTVNRGFIAQTGDPTGGGDGGESIWGVLEGPLKRYYTGEDTPRIKHKTTGLISFVGDKDNMIGSQFFITLAPELTYLDAQHCVFGEVVEGFDVLEVINEAICDNKYRPYQDIRITHTVVIDDPFPDPEGLHAPDASPEPTADRLQGGRIAPDEEIDESVGKSAGEINEIIAQREAKARATILEMVGDIPDADMAPPENVLFVCKLNPVTSDDDLEIIFSRFGKIKSCEVIRDKKTGDSLQYAFVEFENKESCEDAYFKMDNVLIDDRRIHVDFSQSVAKIKWHGKGRGVTHYNDRGEKTKEDKKNDIGNGRYKFSSKQESKKEDTRMRETSKYDRHENGSYRDKYNDARDRSYSDHPRSYYRTENRDRYSSRNDNRNRYDNTNTNRSRHRSRSRENVRENRQYSRDSHVEKQENTSRHSSKYKQKSRSDDKPKKQRRPPVSESDSESEEEHVKKSKKTKKKKSKKQKKKNSSSESDSSAEYKKSNTKKKKSKKYKSSESDSESSSDSDEPKRRKSKKS